MSGFEVLELADELPGNGAGRKHRFEAVAEALVGVPRGKWARVQAGPPANQRDRDLARELGLEIEVRRVRTVRQVWFRLCTAAGDATGETDQTPGAVTPPPRPVHIRQFAIAYKQHACNITETAKALGVSQDDALELLRLAKKDGQL